MNRNIFKGRLLALTVIFCLLLNLIGLAALPGIAGAAEGDVYPVDDLATKAVEFIHQAYIDDPEKIDAYTAYVLSLAGEDLAADKWSKDGQTLKAKIIAQAELLDGSGGGAETKKIAQSLLALNQWGDDGAGKLADLLIDKHDKHSEDSFENNVFVDMLAYLALGKAGRIDSIAEAGCQYILDKQSVTEGVYGSWGETYEGNYWVDFMSTAQAIRALTYLSEYGQEESVQEAVYNGLSYLRSHQQGDGGVYLDFDDPVVDTAEIIITLHRLDIDPATWENDQGQTPVSYMLNNALNDDGSFGGYENDSTGNIFGATEALYAYVLLGGTPSDKDQPNEGGSPEGPVSNHCTVKMAIVGADGDILYGPSSITLEKNGPLGLTVLAVLEASGVSYTRSGDLITEIYGQANSGMSGWMYKVNNTVAAVAASKKNVSDGDRIIWWYSTDVSSSGPTWSEITQGNIVVQPPKKMPLSLEEQNQQLPVGLQLSPEILQVLENIDELPNWQEKDFNDLTLGENNTWVEVVNKEQALTRSQQRSLGEKLATAATETKQEIKADDGGLVHIPGRLVLSIPAQALDKDRQITVDVQDIFSGTDGFQQMAAESNLPNGQQLLAGYKFGPEGTKFSSPVLLSLKIALPPLAKPQDLALVWYDKDKNQWLPLPAVFDASKGILAAKVTHFSNFAVLASESRRSFKDVSETSFAWAQNVIEILAGAGIIAGVDEQYFEPSRAVTRGEFVCLLLRALELEEKTVAESPFKDVAGDDWYGAAITAASEVGLIKGYDDGTFAPGNTITREEVTAILVRALELPLAEEEINFQDAGEISSWARTSVAAAADKGLIKGFTDGTFRPQADTSRAECAGLIHRIVVDFL